ncbi:sulfurtransferase [Solilutibacter tolerans]|uniref:Thiosulfate/3-mercaptopyruvate sulfurtransferase n=1 Tax=Solilutibacter tolerans TaxID=1604334 RepID=A0A1N6P8G7_9GAMM|nr:sulfurtransferase [Lysobacter tolerans]SIQ00546.1 thiosulfate/3-mercaptopyruvate sulfurtransferase [Lysobacter tolerans]
MNADIPFWSTLIDVASLADATEGNDIVLLDCRSVLTDPDAGARIYAQGHLPGAFHANLERDLSDMSQLGQGRHPWPRAEDLARTLSRWGITPHTQVVAYDADNGMYASRAWCLLRMIGHERIAVLDGGLKAWQAAGLPIQIEAPSLHDAVAPYPGDFAYGRLFDHDDVAAHVEHGGLLVDARAPERFRGEVEPIDKTAGHVPGAVNRPFMANLAEDGRFKSRDELFAEFAELLGGRTPSDMVAMCGSGVTACHHLLAMAHAGLQGAKLYKGSWSGWISDSARPIATGEA